jgi:hypothetical protein
MPQEHRRGPWSADGDRLAGAIRINVLIGTNSFPSNGLVSRSVTLVDRRYGGRAGDSSHARRGRQGETGSSERFSDSPSVASRGGPGAQPPASVSRLRETSLATYPILWVVGRMGGGRGPREVMGEAAGRQGSPGASARRVSMRAPSSSPMGSAIATVAGVRAAWHQRTRAASDCCVSKRRPQAQRCGNVPLTGARAGACATHAQCRLRGVRRCGKQAPWRSALAALPLVRCRGRTGARRFAGSCSSPRRSWARRCAASARMASAVMRSTPRTGTATRGTGDGRAGSQGHGGARRDPHLLFLEAAAPPVGTACPHRGRRRPVKIGEAAERSEGNLDRPSAVPRYAVGATGGERGRVPSPAGSSGRKPGWPRGPGHSARRERRRRSRVFFRLGYADLRLPRHGAGRTFDRSRLLRCE